MGGTETKELSYSALVSMRGGGDAPGELQDLQSVRQRLRNASSTLKHLANKAAHRLASLFAANTDDTFISAMVFSETNFPLLHNSAHGSVDVPSDSLPEILGMLFP